MVYSGRLLTLDELAEWLGVSPATVRDWRVDGKGPPAVKLGEGRNAAVRYRREDVEEWLLQVRDAEDEST